MSANLFRRLGGAAGLVLIADNAVDRHAANPALAARFRGQDLPQIKALCVGFLAAGTGGPMTEAALGEAVAHAWMNLSDIEVAAVADDLAAALQEQGVGQADVGQVIQLLGAQGSDAVRPRRAALGND